MFSLELVQSFVSYIKSEGAKAFLALYKNEKKEEELLNLSLPHLANICFSSEKAGTILELKKYSKERNKRTTGLRFKGDNQVLEEHERLEGLSTQAIELINKNWPELSDIISEIQPQINKTNSNEPFESASNPSFFGEVLYRMDSDSYVKWAEIYAHEIGHHYLNIILTTKSDQEVFNQPWDNEDYSAIRDTNRPLIGIYHGAFAESCMLIFATKVLNNEISSDYEKDEAQKIVNKFSEIFKRDYNVLNKYDLLDFDSHVREFLEEAKGVVNEL